MARSHCRKASTGGRFLPHLPGKLGQLVDLAAIDRLEQGLARREVAVERADADAGPPGDGLQARVRAAGAENPGSRLEQPLAVADRIGARLARNIC